MRARIVAFLTALTLIGMAGCAAPALAGALACETVSFADLDARATSAGGLEWHEMAPVDRAVFVAAYNAVPPVSDLAPARVGYYVADGVRDQVVVVLIGSDGCVMTMGPLSPETLAAILAGESI